MSDSDRDSLLMSVERLRSRVADARIAIIDCRFDLMDPTAGRRDYIDGHIPGAAYADLDSDLAAPVGQSTGRHPLPEVGQAEQTFRRLGVSSERPVVLYDASGGAIAARAWWMLRWLGHPDTTVLDGGIQAWMAAGLPLEPGQNHIAAGDFNASPRDGLVLTTTEIVASLQSMEQINLIDARDSARYRGETEPIDPIAGHVPGSFNLPFSEFLDATGHWKPAAEIRSALAALLGDDPGSTWSAMCGSGVTACHLALSGLLAGYREPRLYIGSWSEWIRDPDRPIGSGAPNLPGQG